MIGNHPNLTERTASGSGEIDAGDLGSIEVDYDITYTTDGNSVARGSYKVTAFLPLSKNPKETIAVELTERISESAIDSLLEDHLF